MKETIHELVFVIEDTLRHRQGNIIIPAFALGYAGTTTSLSRSVPARPAAPIRSSLILRWPTK